MSEHQFQKSAVQLFGVILPDDVAWFAVPNGGQRHATVAAKLKAEGVIAGVADIILIYLGKAFGLELKVGRNGQSASQKAWQANFEKAGGKYRVVKTIDQILDALKAWGIPTREVRS